MQKLNESIAACCRPFALIVPNFNRCLYCVQSGRRVDGRFAKMCLFLFSNLFIPILLCVSTCRSPRLDDFHSSVYICQYTRVYKCFGCQKANELETAVEGFSRTNPRQNLIRLTFYQIFINTRTLKRSLSFSIPPSLFSFLASKSRVRGVYATYCRV